MKRAIVVLVALVLGVVLLRFGCDEPPPSIVLWHAYRGDEEKALAEVVARWAAKTGKRVELLAVPFDAYTAKLGAAVPHAHGPDVFIEAHERLGIYRKDHIVALAGDAFPDADVSAFDATAVRAITDTATGERWGVPLSSKCVALYMRDDRIAKTPETLEEIAAMRASLPADVYPLAYEAQNAYHHAAVMHAFGVSILDAKDSFAFTGKDAARSITLVKDLTAQRVVPEEPGGALVVSLFKSGKAATVIDGPWLAAQIDRKEVPYRVAPLPRIAETGRRMMPYLTVEAALLTPSGAKREDARSLARFLGGEEAAIVRATVGHQIVANLAAWKDPRVAGDDMLSAFHDAAKEAIPTPTSTNMRATWVPAEQAIRKVFRGQMDAEAALAEAKTRYEDVMKPPPPPPSPAPAIVALGVLLLIGAFLVVRRARQPGFARSLRASVPAYKYVTHAAITILVLVVFPLVAGAVTSFFAGTRDDPQYVGFGNYLSILTARGGPLLGSGSFYLTLLVTIGWTVANVALHVAIGLGLGVALSRPMMKLRAIYRVLLILPWAVPSYVTALAWKGMFHRQFGAINAILTALGAEPVSWFSKFSTAFAANVSTNVWLGFPFMMVVTMGALTAIPKDVLEAAEVDGATRWQRFRLVTFPLLKPALLPAVVLGAVWTFNMFNVVFLVSGGEPDGTTDILVSEAYRWAFTRDAQYGYAAAYAVLIFFLLLGGSRLLSRLAGKRGEEEAA
jgi:arabinogalactan oligomer/maltooligosaccharide transport system permease protein